MIHFFATKFYIHFSGNPQSNGVSLSFAGSKTLQKAMKESPAIGVMPTSHGGWRAGTVGSDLL